MQVRPGCLSANARAAHIASVSCSVLGECATPLCLLTDLGTYSRKKSPPGKPQGHILVQESPDL